MLVVWTCTTRPVPDVAVAAPERITAITDDGTELHAAVFDEHQVRAAAGLTMVAGAVAFAFAYFDRNYTPLQVVTCVFFVEFLIRLTLGLRYSPAGAQGIAQFMPGTAAAYGLSDPFDAAAAIDAQGHLMRDLLRQFASIPLALAAYNAGPGLSLIHI